MKINLIIRSYLFMAKKKKFEVTSAQKLGVGVGLTAAAVAAAGAYFLYGSEHAEQNRKRVKGWALKAKGDVLDALENAEHMTEEQFQAVVAQVLDTYDKARSLSKKEMSDFKKEMQLNWEELVASGVAKVLTAEQIAKREEKKKAAKKAAKKSTKTTAKKTAKKASKTAKKTTTKKAAKKTTKKSK